MTNDDGDRPAGEESDAPAGEMTEESSSAGQLTEGQMPDLGELMQTAQKMQQELGRVQQELAKQTVEGSAGGGMVIAVANGKQQLLSLRIEPEMVDPKEIDMLQDLVVAAVNQALARAAELSQKEMSKVGGALAIKLPGVF